MKYAIILVIALGLIAVGTSNSFATTSGDPIFMQFPGIDGDVTAAGHEKWIEVNSFQWGASNTPSTTSGGAGKVSVQDISITKLTDKTSTALLKHVLTGDHTTNPVVIDFVSTSVAGPSTYLQITLEQVMISSYSMSSSGDRPTESLTINFAKIKYDSISTDPNTGAPIHNIVTYDLMTHIVG